MSTLPLRTLCLCVKLPPRSFQTRGRSTFVRHPLTPVRPFFATLTTHLQPTENKTALSPFPATLASRVKHKSFVCHSYKKHQGVVRHAPLFARHLSLGSPATRRNARNSNPLMRLLHNSRTPGAGGYASSATKLQSSPLETCPTTIAAQILLSAFDYQLSSFSASHQSRITSHRTRVTEHRSRITPP
jgi:hypothetical protein